MNWFSEQQQTNETECFDVTEAISCFQSVLCAAWPRLLKLIAQDQTNEFFDDWAQANWEMLVECSIHPKAQVVLEIYGGGADCNDPFSRVWRPEAKATHQVHCEAGNKQKMVDVLLGQEIKGPAIIEELCTIENEWVSKKPPFDHVVLQGDETRAVSLNGLRFFARPAALD